MKALFTRVACATALTFGLITHALASADEASLALQQQWEHAKYELNGKDQEQAFETLLQTVEQDKKEYPKSAKVLAWSGIINATFASVKGGLGALKYAKAARSDLEEAIAIDEPVLNGAADNTLGMLYLKVPGWPVGFGDKKKAKKLLKAGLDADPNGIDGNYFWGEYLRDQGDYAEAMTYYQKALEAPAREGRALADAGRRAEVEQAIAEVQQQLD